MEGLDIKELTDLVGKTISVVRKWKSKDGVIKILQLGFTDGSECGIAANNPTIDVNLVGDDERIIPLEMQKRFELI